MLVCKDNVETAVGAVTLQQNQSPNSDYRKRELRSLVGGTRRQNADTHWRDDPHYLG